MEAVEVDDYADYQDFLEVHPDEFDELFNTILINVTGFFRDPEAWEYARAARSSRRSLRAEGGRRADPGLVRRLRVGRGGVHVAMLLAEALATTSSAHG